MKQHECDSKTAAVHKICKLLNIKYTQEIKKSWFQLFNELIKSKGTSDTIDYIGNDEEDNEYDCSVWFGYDNQSKQWLVGIVE